MSKINNDIILSGIVRFTSDIRFTKEDAGIYYAQKLVPEFRLFDFDGVNVIEMKIGIPRSLKLDPVKIALLKKYFEEDPPLNAYEEIKQRNQRLYKIAGQKEEELRQSRIIDEKKTEFISIASHEIKTPITIIKAYTQIAKGLKDQCSDKVRDILETVDVQTTKLLSLVQQLLDVSKVENGTLQYNMEQTELRSFVPKVIEILRQILPAHEISLNLPDDVNLTIDKLRMEQVFSNILNNAAKYSSKGSSIRVDCKILDDNFVQVAVADEGIGIAPASMASIFEKFYRAKDVVKSHTGLGMGLYISSKIVADHGGKIWVESSEGSGSTFYFTMPYKGRKQ